MEVSVSVPVFYIHISFSDPMLFLSDMAIISLQGMSLEVSKRANALGEVIWHLLKSKISVFLHCAC